MPLLLTPYEQHLEIDSPRMAAARRPLSLRLAQLRDEDADLISLVSLWGLDSPRKLRCYHGHNEGKLAGGGREWRQRRRKGTVEGISDLVFWEGGEDFEGVAIELKAGDRTLDDVTDAQRAWLLHFRKRRWIAEVCFGFVEADALLRLCFG